MAYAVVRTYAGSGAMTAEQLCARAIRELAPKLAQGRPGLVRYSTYAFSDGRFGSFSVYESKTDAGHAAQIAAEWVKSGNAMQGFALDDAMEGEFIYAVQGFKPIELSKGEQVPDVDGPVHSLAHIYTTDASGEDLIAALEQEAGDVIRNLPGLSRFGVVKLIDRRIGMFMGFDTLENARKFAEQAKALRNKTGSRLATLLPPDPQVLEGRLVGIYRAK